jgi:hypothetical protein
MADSDKHINFEELDFVVQSFIVQAHAQGVTLSSFSSGKYWGLGWD